MATVYDQSSTEFCYKGSTPAVQQLQSDLSLLFNEYDPTPELSPSPVPVVTAQNGHWGTNGAELDVTANGGTLYFNCSRGSLDQSLILDSNGDFDVTGTVVYTGGPIIVGHPNTAKPARYTGNVNGNEMTISIAYSDNSDHAQTANYTLLYGTSGSLGVCPD
jgi:hypothetical protein